MKIALIGPYPPPYGGISVHIKRVRQMLENEDIECIIYCEKSEFPYNPETIPIGSYKRLLFRIPFIKADIIHFHSIDKRVRLLLGFYKLFGRKIILTVHGDSMKNQIYSSGPLVRKLLLGSLKAIDKIICVNPQDKVLLSDFGIEPRRVEVIPSYLSPVERPEDIRKIPQKVHDFIDSSNFLISANGFIRFHNNEDMYGFDMLVSLAKSLIDKGMDVSLLVFLLGVEAQNQKEEEYYNFLKDRISTPELNKKIFIYESRDAEFYPVLSKSSLFIRPTNTDGYGVSIAEAIYYKVPAIASDVCKRPEGAIIFKSRNFEDLYNKVVAVINNYKSCKEAAQNIHIKDNSQELMMEYKRLVE